MSVWANYTIGYLVPVLPRISVFPMAFRLMSALRLRIVPGGTIGCRCAGKHWTDRMSCAREARADPRSRHGSDVCSIWSVIISRPTKAGIPRTNCASAI